MRNCIISREAVEAGFGGDVDFAQLIKLYGETPHPAGRYSPAQINGYKDFLLYRQPRPQSNTPAMAAGLTERLWSVEDIVDLLDAARGSAEEPWPLQPTSSGSADFKLGQCPF